MHRTILALLAVLAIAVAACSAPAASPSDAEATTEASAEASATEEATPSEEESEEESAEESATEAAIPSIDLPGSAPELEDALPDEVEGVALQKFSMRGEEFMAQGDDNAEFLAFLERVGAEPDDVSVAFAFGVDPESSAGISVFAFRVEGADTDQLVDELRTSLEEEGTASEMTEANVAGKDVLVGESTDESTPGTVYLYGVGDIVFFTAATDEAQAEAILSQLP